MGLNGKGGGEHLGRVGGLETGINILYEKNSFNKRKLEKREKEI